MASVRLTVHGTPQSAGSKRAFMPRGGRYPVVVDDNPKSRGWKQQVARACHDQYGGEFLEGPLEIELHFFLPRPKGHFGTGRNAGVVKASAPAFPIVKPDVDKLSRAILDGLTGQLYRDDALIVRKYASKRYGEPARVEILVSEIEDQAVREPTDESQLALADAA
jgi:Holliday junction resolvase RusA-like endonuclease